MHHSQPWGKPSVRWLTEIHNNGSPVAKLQFRACVLPGNHGARIHAAGRWCHHAGETKTRWNFGRNCPSATHNNGSYLIAHLALVFVALTCREACVQVDKKFIKFIILSQNCNYLNKLYSTPKQIQTSSNSKTPLTDFATDCLLTGQEQACSRFTWLFVWLLLFVTMPKMAEYTDK